jgi:ferredoxin
MSDKRHVEIGETVAVDKAALTGLLAALRVAGYMPLGPQIRDAAIVYETLDRLDQLPQGYVTEQAPGRFRLLFTGHNRYFDFIPAAPSWKQFLFPPRLDAFELSRSAVGWHRVGPDEDTPAFAFIGVRACELAAIQIQDKAFVRGDFSDPVYRSRRERVFILAVNCLHPAGTCFCAAMSTGPRVRSGFDLCITEIEDVFLVEIGSELGLRFASSTPWMTPSAFMLGNAERGVDQATRQAATTAAAPDASRDILDNLEHPHWQAVAEQCLSCGNCTLVCPTCFCWDVSDQTNLAGTETRRERVWDSCFNPAYSHQAGGNTRPTCKARYRQWLSHKFATWHQQYGTSGCVGCGRCVTWCPVGIDVRKEISALHMESPR